MITAAQLVKELHSATCPACNADKIKKTFFCGKCYAVLPRHMAHALRQELGKGKEQAYDEAKRCIRQRRATASQMKMKAGHHTPLA